MMVAAAVPASAVLVGAGVAAQTPTEPFDLLIQRDGATRITAAPDGRHAR